MLVAGVDSSTQSCKVVIRDANTGSLMRSGRAAHPEGSEVDPRSWWNALAEAVGMAGGLDDVAAVAVGAQQHGMVTLDETGGIVRDALLWNDVRSASAARELIGELGDGDQAVGAATWAKAVGSVPVASLTVTKLRWLADHEPAHAGRVAAVALPHDWLTWRLAGAGPLEGLITDRSDASGTGYWSPTTEDYRYDLLRQALGHQPLVPRVLAPMARAGTGVAGDIPGLHAGLVLGPGAGDNAAAAFGLGMGPGDVAISIGTSGVVSAVSMRPALDPTGIVNGFADATGHYLSLCCTLNASRVLDAACTLLDVRHEQLSRLALSAPSGADGLVLVPFLEGERAPDKPQSTGALHGLRLDNASAAHLARAAVEGMLCALADGLDELRRHHPGVERLLLIGGGARSEAVRRIAPTIFDQDVIVPAPGEYVADGAARQAAWVLAGGETPPIWQLSGEAVTYPGEARSVANPVRSRYTEARDLTVDRLI